MFVSLNLHYMLKVQAILVTAGNPSTQEFFLKICSFVNLVYIFDVPLMGLVREVGAEVFV